jgi:hypothetical protein
VLYVLFFLSERAREKIGPEVNLKIILETIRERAAIVIPDIGPKNMDQVSSIPLFMEKGINVSDIVLIILATHTREREQELEKVKDEILGSFVMLKNTGLTCLTGLSVDVYPFLGTTAQGRINL